MCLCSRACVCVYLIVYVHVCICVTAACVFVCGGCTLCVFAFASVCTKLLRWQLGAYNTCLLHCYSVTHKQTRIHSLSLSLPVSHDGEWSRCWGPIVAQCHFLVLLISSLCCRWLSLKGSTHMLMQTHTHTHRQLHTHTQPCYLLTSPSTALPLAPQWQQRLWLSA